MNGSTMFLPPRSSETAATVSLSSRLPCSFSRDGISLRQGWHHVAHRLSRTSLPLKSARATQLPERSWKETSGAGCGGEAAINSPGLRSGSTARAAPTASRSATATVPKEANRRPDPPGSDPGKRDPAGPGAAGPNALWGGRFAEGPAAIMRRINASIGVDKRLYAEDIAGSQAHCAMLVAQNILSPEDGEAIARGLEQIRGEIEAGSFVFRDEHEDIHLNIEARVDELIRPVAGRLHPARSPVRELDRCCLRPRFRGRVSRRRGAGRHAFVALCGGGRHLVERRLRLYPAQRCLYDRQFDHAAEAESRCRRAGARQDRALQRRAHCIADGDEGPAARLSEGYAGRQGAGVRGR